MPEPTTEAGQKLNDDLGYHAFLDGTYTEDRIAAIEAEAAALALDQARSPQGPRSNDAIAADLDWNKFAPETPSLRAALESVVRLIEVIPYSVDVEQAGMQVEVAIATARAALASQPVPEPGLDVAWALRRVKERLTWMGGGPPGIQINYHQAMLAVEAIEAEAARLTSPEPTPEEKS